MISQKDLQELVDFRQDGAMVLSIYLNTDRSQQPREQSKLILREKLQEVADKSLNEDVQRVEHFFGYEYDWQSKGAVVFSCQRKGFWRTYSLAVPVRNIVSVGERPYLKPLTDLLDEYARYGVIVVDREGARLFSVQLGEIQEETEAFGEEVKRHKQGGWSAATYQRREDMAILHNLKMAAQVVTEFCKEEKCGQLVLAGADETLSQFRELLPKDIQRKVIGTISADMTTSSAKILERSMEVALAVRHQQENALVKQMITAAAKGEAGVIGLADTLYAIREGRVLTLLVEQGYEAPGAACENCGYISPVQGQKCLFCRQEMRPMKNAVDLATQKTLESGGTVRVIAGNEELAKAGHIGAILRY